MGIDLIVLVLVVLLAFLGYRRGLLRHLASLGALVVASLGVGVLGGHVAGWVVRRSAMPSPLAYALCCIVAWIVLFILCRIVFGRLAKRLGSDKEGDPKPWNRKLGALAGAAEALILAWFVVGMLDALPEDFRRQLLPRVHRELEGSPFTTWVVRPTNPATLLELQPLVGDVAVLSQHPEALRGIEQKEEIRAIMNHPKVTAVLADKPLVQDWLEGRYGRFFSDRKVRDALEDEQLRGMLRELKVRAIIHEAADRARREARPQPPAKAPGATGSG